MQSQGDEQMVPRHIVSKMRDKAVFGYLAGGIPGQVSQIEFWAMAQTLNSVLMDDELDLQKRVNEISTEMKINLKGAAAKYLPITVPVKQTTTNGKH